MKAKIRNIAKSKNISAQAVLQNYLMNHFLYRLSLTECKDNFILKGGILISSIIGIEHRSTMDIDVTLNNFPLQKKLICQAFDKACSVSTNDGISFIFKTINPIRDDDIYGGYRILFSAAYGKINAPMSIDISTGDVISPSPQKHSFNDLFDDNFTFEMWSYPIETILAEKTETVLSRGIDNTRLRDFYDIYVLSHNNYDYGEFQKALVATSKHRGSYENISD